MPINYSSHCGGCKEDNKREEDDDGIMIKPLLSSFLVDRDGMEEGLRLSFSCVDQDGNLAAFFTQTINLATLGSFLYLHYQLVSSAKPHRIPT